MAATKRVLFASDSFVGPVGHHLRVLLPHVEVEHLMIPGMTVSKLVSVVRRSDLRQYGVVILHVGECDMFDRTGHRRSFPKALASSLIDLYQEVSDRGCRVLLTGLPPKRVPATDEERHLASRHGVSKYTALEYNRSARKTNKKVRAALVETDGLPIEVPELWRKDYGVSGMFMLDCVHLTSEAQRALAKAIATHL